MTARRDEKHLSFGNLDFGVHIARFKGFQCNTSLSPIGTEDTVWHHPTWLRLLCYPINKMIDIQMIMNAMESPVTSPTIVYSIVYSVADQRRHKSSASLAFVRGIHRWPVNSQHKGPVMPNMFPFDDVIMEKHSNVHINKSPLQSIHCVCIMAMFTGSS